jgi:outer membrane receptor for ferrienterochelin and colicin
VARLESGGARTPARADVLQHRGTASHPGPAGQRHRFRKSPFWVWYTRYEVGIAKGLKLFAAVNNIFDLNQHPIFIALDEVPCIANPVFQNGACGNSMPGREFIVGLQGRW